MNSRVILRESDWKEVPSDAVCVSLAGVPGDMGGGIGGGTGGGGSASGHDGGHSVHDAGS